MTARGCHLDYSKDNLTTIRGDCLDNRKDNPITVRGGLLDNRMNRPMTAEETTRHLLSADFRGAEHSAAFPVSS